MVVSLQNFFGFLASYDGIIALVSRCERLKGKKWLCGYLVRQPSARTSSVQSGIESGVEGQSITNLPLTEHGNSRYCSTGRMIRYGVFFCQDASSRAILVVVEKEVFFFRSSSWSISYDSKRILCLFYKQLVCGSVLISLRRNGGTL